MSTELVDFDPTRSQDRPSGVWDYVSPSRLNLWLKCPLAFKLRYIDGVVTPTSPAQFVGRMVHRALEAVYRHRQVGLAIEPDVLHERLRADWGELAAAEQVAIGSTVEEAECQNQVVKLVDAYLAHVNVHQEPRPLAVEAALEAPMLDPATGEDLGIPLVGIVDLVLADTDGPRIVDFKTSARSSAPLEIANEVQLGAYAWLTRAATGQAEAGLEIRQLVKTKSPQVGCYSYARRTAADFQRLFALLRAYLDDLDCGRFVYRPGMACAMCEHRDTHCRAWSG